MPQRPLDHDDPSVMFNVRLPGKTAARLKTSAKAEGETTSAFLRRLIEADASYASGVREREKAHASYASSLERERDRLRNEAAKLKAESASLREEITRLKAEIADLRRAPRGKPGAMDFATFATISKALHPDHGEPTKKERDEAMKALTNWRAGAKKKAGRS
jgi:predicted  nucleic acid-binding Zn-ribbon protein